MESTPITPNPEVPRRQNADALRLRRRPHPRCLRWRIRHREGNDLQTRTRILIAALELAQTKSVGQTAGRSTRSVHRIRVRLRDGLLLGARVGANPMQRPELKDLIARFGGQVKELIDSDLPSEKPAA